MMIISSQSSSSWLTNHQEAVTASSLELYKSRVYNGNGQSWCNFCERSDALFVCILFVWWTNSPFCKASCVSRHTVFWLAVWCWCLHCILWSTGTRIYQKDPRRCMLFFYSIGCWVQLEKFVEMIAALITLGKTLSFIRVTANVEISSGSSPL
jgi:hypothetical protein